MDLGEQLGTLLNSDFLDGYISNPEVFNKRIIPLKEADVSSRVFNHWKKFGLLNISRAQIDKRQWEKLSFIDFLWIECIKELRSFGIPLKIISEIKEFIFQPFNYEEAAEVIDTIKKDNNLDFVEYKKIISSLERKIKDRTDIDEYNKKLLLTAIDNLNDKDLLGRLNINDIENNKFEELILASVYNKQQTGFFYFPDELDDKIVPYYDEFLSKNKEFLQLFYRSHFYISITSKYQRFLNQEDKAKYLSSFGILKDSELKLLSLLRVREFKVISIIPHESYTIIETTKEFKKPSFADKEIADLNECLENANTTISHERGNDGLIHSTITRKYKI